MIIFYADGRLGNQLFQLAFLQKISKKKEWIITFNLEQILNVFDVFLKIKNFRIKIKIIKSVYQRVFLIFFETLASLRIVSVVYEEAESINYKKKFGLLWFISYVRTGFFQSEKFFDKDQFLKSIKLKNEYINLANLFLKDISDDFTKIFIHVRRGDYLKEPYLGTEGIDLPMNYYNKAISLINEKNLNPYYIILSDDFNFVKTVFSNLNNKIISQNSFEVDMAIMSLCRGAIISNSSYSWWGSFLMKEKKIVIMPKYWFGWKQRRQSHEGINLSFAEVIDFNI